MAKDNLGLADLLGALRKELERAQQQVSDSGMAPLLALKGAEVEIQFAVKKELRRQTTVGGGLGEPM